MLGARKMPVELQLKTWVVVALSSALRRAWLSVLYLLCLLMGTVWHFSAWHLCLMYDIHWGSITFCLKIVFTVICKCFEIFLRKALFQSRGLLNSSTCNEVNIAEKIKGQRKMSLIGHNYLGLLQLRCKGFG